jgi:hypothetical protein
MATWAGIDAQGLISKGNGRYLYDANGKQLNAVIYENFAEEVLGISATDVFAQMQALDIFVSDADLIAEFKANG